MQTSPTLQLIITVDQLIQRC